MDLGMQELEAAINHWRMQCPVSGHALALSPEVNVLATQYALMIFNRTPVLPLAQLEPGARALLEAWRAAHPSS
jgi:hypothetical protein